MKSFFGLSRHGKNAASAGHAGDLTVTVASAASGDGGAATEASANNVLSVPGGSKPLVVDSDLQHTLTVLAKPAIDFTVFSTMNLAAASAALAVSVDIANMTSGESEAPNEMSTLTAMTTAAVSAFLNVKELRERINKLSLAQTTLLKLIEGQVLKCAYKNSDGVDVQVTDLSAESLNAILRTHRNIHIELKADEAEFDLNARSLTDKSSLATIALSALPVVVYALTELANRVGFAISEEQRVASAVVTGVSPGQVFEKIVAVFKAYERQVVDAYALTINRLYVESGNLARLKPDDYEPFLAFLSDTDAARFRSAHDQALRALLAAPAEPDLEAADEKAALVTSTTSMRIAGP